MNTPYGIQAHPQPQAAPQQYGHTAIVALLLLVLVLVVEGSNAQAQTVGPSLFLDPPQAAAGAVVLVNGQGFSPGGGMLTIFWDGQQMATHPMDVGDTFSIPFPVPDQANPGDHRLEVCLGDPCATDQKVRASALFQVSTTLPRFTSTVGYVFDTDKTQAAEFSDLLSKVGIDLVAIPLTDVTQTDWSAYPLVIVGSDTGHGSRWGSAKQVAALQKAPRIVGVGAGGYAFFGQLDLTIGYPNGTAAQAQSITAGDPQLTSLRVPYDLTTLVRNQRKMALFNTPVDSVAIDLANQPTDILAHAYLGPMSKPSTLGVIAGQAAAHCEAFWARPAR